MKHSKVIPRFLLHLHLVFGVIMGTSTPAQSEEFEFSINEQSLHIAVALERPGCGHPLAIDSFNLRRVHPLSAEFSIVVSFKPDAKSCHVITENVQRGFVFLQTGAAAPQLSPGGYDVVVNGYGVGRIDVDSQYKLRFKKRITRPQPSIEFQKCVARVAPLCRNSILTVEECISSRCGEGSPGGGK